MTRNKRRARRVSKEDSNQASVNFRITKNGKVRIGSLANLSNGGVFIATSTQCKTGVVIHMEFTVPSRFQIIPAIGKVVWQGERHGKVGIGVEFTEIEPVDLYDLMRGVKQGGWLYALGVTSEP